MTVKIDGSNGLLQAYDYQVLTTGFSYTFAAGTQVLLAVPAGTLATGTVVMPTTPADGMNITITSTQEITALTVNANTGQSIVGGGASYLPANGSRTFIYRLSNTTWYPQAVAIPQPLTDIQTFNAGDADLTWDKPTGGQTMVKIQVWAGGGGGSRAAATGGTAGGGGGAYNEWIGPISYMGATAAVTVGAAGVGRITSAGVGTAGGNSSIAIANYPGGSKTIIAYGGGGANQGGSIYGGGGGGLLGAGTSTAGAAGIGYESPADATNNASGSVPAITAGGLGNNSTTIPYGSIYGGGGGSTNGSTGLGGRSVYGGGGGVSTGGTAGVSLYGGAGGVNAIGSTPAGGGGSSSTANTNGSNGGAGQVVITSW